LGTDPNAFRASILLRKTVLIHIKRETALARFTENISLMPVSRIIVFSVLVCHRLMLSGVVGEMNCVA
jgi:hypothetical protein